MSLSGKTNVKGYFAMIGIGQVLNLREGRFERTKNEKGDLQLSESLSEEKTPASLRSDPAGISGTTGLNPPERMAEFSRIPNREHEVVKLNSKLPVRDERMKKRESLEVQI
jgi:hypothetical protein